MSEKNLRHKVRDALKPAHVIQVENGMCDGTPDTYASFTAGAISWSGWLELKYGSEVPKRDTTAVFKSVNRGLETEQGVWLFRGWQACPGSTWILAQLEKKFYLVAGSLAFEFNDMTIQELEWHLIELKDLRHLLSNSVGIPGGDKL